MGYNGTIELIAGVKPANNGNFPMVNAKDVYVDDDTRLDAKLNGLDDSIDDLNAAVVTDATLSQTGKPADAKAVGDAINNITIEVDATLSQSGKAADAKATGDAVGDLKTQISDIVDRYIDIRNYFYKKDIYINASGVETALTGYDTYFIPTKPLDIIEVYFDHTDPFYNVLNTAYVFHALNNDDSVTSLGTTDSGTEHYWQAANDIFSFINKEQHKGIYLTVYAGNENKLSLAINTKYALLKDYQQNNTVKLGKTTEFADGTPWLRNDGTIRYVAGYYSVKVHAKAGDKFIFKGSTGLATVATYFDGTSYDRISPDTEAYSVENNGVMYVLLDNNNVLSVVYVPKDSPKVDSDNVIGTVDSPNPFKGMKGVAFGTSLTYRGQEGQTGGYLNYLPDLSEMTWDNQGVGSSMIYGSSSSSILNKIIGYTGYSDKDVVIIEGFINDFYENLEAETPKAQSPLGDYTDTGTSTVCGCLRTAIAHILTEKKTATIYVVLDHYGKGITAQDVICNGETQYSYYKECAKVCESMGVYVIKEYALSGFNSYSDQFLRDNIHCSDLGAKQSAQTIWDYMFTHKPKVQS